MHTHYNEIKKAYFLQNFYFSAKKRENPLVNWPFSLCFLQVCFLI